MNIYDDHYTDADKHCLLADSMTDREAKKLVTDYASEGYE